MVSGRPRWSTRQTPRPNGGESVQQLSEAIESLPPKERMAVTLYYKEDLRLKEIAEVMKLSPSRISRLLSKATFELGEMLKTKSFGGSCLSFARS
jgi:RNA polymerase sigma factor for flagellar operon FliA